MWCNKRKRMQQISEVLDISRARCPKVLFTPTWTAPCLQVEPQNQDEKSWLCESSKRSFQGGPAVIKPSLSKQVGHLQKVGKEADSERSQGT